MRYGNVRSPQHGEPSQSICEWFDEEPDRWAVTQEGFRATASLLVEDVTGAVTLSDSITQLIDIEGGHGPYTMEICRRHPQLSTMIFDVQGALEAIIDDIPAKLAGHVETRAGDYRTDDLGVGGKYDLALLFNVTHAYDFAENTAFFARVADALAPGGRAIVLDQWEGADEPR